MKSTALRKKSPKKVNSSYDNINLPNEMTKSYKRGAPVTQSLQSRPRSG